MNEFEQVLDDSLQRIAGDASTAEESLAQHPEHSAQLKPLLKIANHLQRGQALRPSPAFKARTRAKLTAHTQAHPKRSRRTFPPAVRMMIGIAAVVMIFVLTGTAFAQSALPGEPLYGWKLSSEQAWRAVASDRVGVDLSLAGRRADELEAVHADVGNEAKAMDGYRDILSRLESESDAHNSERILPTLRAHQSQLSAAGITIPELNLYLSHPSSNPGSGSSAPGDHPHPTKMPKPKP